MIKNNQEEKSKVNLEEHKTQIVSFYAYKGGIGKTTALIKTALLLAEKGKKVAIIDMDLEEPGFYDAFSSDLRLEGGFVNYLFNRYNGRVKSEALEITGLVKKLSLRKSGAIYVIPAGRVDMEYVNMLKSLRERRINNNRDIREVINKISKSFDIDYVLIDARHGINFWGGLNLNTIVDEVMLFAYPDLENIQGVNVFLQSIEDKDKCTLVFSKVYDSEAAHKELQNLIKRVDMNKNFIKINYDSEMAQKVKYPLEGKINKYSAIRDALLENEIKRKNKKWISDNNKNVEEFLDNLALGNNFNKVLSEEELKIVSSDYYVLAIDDSIDVKNIVESYYDKQNVIDLRFYNKSIKKIVEKHCNSSEFLDICCLSMFSLALVSLDENLNINDTLSIETALGKYFMDFYYKSNNSKGRILNAANYFCEILNAKEDENNKIICVSIERLLEFIGLIEASCKVARAKSTVLYRMLFLIFNVLNRNSKYQFKLVLKDRKYKNDEGFVKEFQNRVLELTWSDLYKKQDILNRIENIFSKLFNLNGYSKVKKNLIFPLSVEEEGVKFKFDEWFVNILKRNRMLSKKNLLEVIKESAALEKMSTKDKTSVISSGKIQAAIQRCSFR